MQTKFTIAQLADPEIRVANDILRSCVHCGFCAPTCPTYALLSDELDGPRGRIYMIKEMLEGDGDVPEPVVTHVDRCLSCLSCMTTCPSDVDYMHLVDIARKRIEESYCRPTIERLMRWTLAKILPYQKRFQLVLRLASWLRIFTPLAPKFLQPLFALLPAEIPKAVSCDTGIFTAEGERQRRVALLAGCVQRTLAPEINAATIRLLTRLGCEVVVPEKAGCCGALTHHLGREAEALASVRSNLAVWRDEINAGELDAIVVNASGCGTMIKDYGYLLRNDPEWAEFAAHISSLACDISELVDDIGLPAVPEGIGGKLVYQSACSLGHGQKVIDAPLRLLRNAGFEVSEPAEPHICCGSAGTYNILQPKLSLQLRERKVANLEALSPDVIVSGNIGCMTQIGGASQFPVLHTAELLDWASGGPKPAAWKVEDE